MLALWRAGLALPAIAEQIEIPIGRLRRWVDHEMVDLTPARWTPAKIERHYGWSPSTYKQYRNAGIMPPPDSPSGESPWWWEHTIRTFARDVLVHRCIECGTWLASAQGAATHRTRLHGRRVH
ncbi:hypothetical protein ON003_07845 [Janibacter hoylei]|uniref:hypothetical protein n=1 Tax=Janibacter hoylei TaxID=364298 RepID=UPI002238FC3F|nr:hypothetical protein [Janibacter hoylei]MCW4601508.1 hypothetical protein [Janibacter hoylei]